MPQNRSFQSSVTHMYLIPADIYNKIMDSIDAGDRDQINAANQENGGNPPPSPPRPPSPPPPPNDTNNVGPNDSLPPFPDANNTQPNQQNTNNVATPRSPPSAAAEADFVPATPQQQQVPFVPQPLGGVVNVPETPANPVNRLMTTPEGTPFRPQVYSSPMDTLPQAHNTAEIGTNVNKTPVPKPPIVDLRQADNAAAAAAAAEPDLSPIPMDTQPPPPPPQLPQQSRVYIPDFAQLAAFMPPTAAAGTTTPRRRKKDSDSLRETLRKIKKTAAASKKKKSPVKVSPPKTRSRTVAATASAISQPVAGPSSQVLPSITPARFYNANTQSTKDYNTPQAWADMRPIFPMPKTKKRKAELDPQLVAEEGEEPNREKFFARCNYCKATFVTRGGFNRHNLRAHQLGPSEGPTQTATPSKKQKLDNNKRTSTSLPMAKRPARIARANINYNEDRSFPDWAANQ